MKNTNIILKLPFIQELISDLHKIEDERIYCRHNLVHFFDVARIFYILTLENSIEISKDLVYSIAFLHDLGRAEEYRSGLDHGIASVELAKKALAYTDFNEEERALAISCIKNHRIDSKSDSIEAIFYRADKLSRDCFNCRRYEACNWDESKKNMEVKY